MKMLKQAGDGRHVGYNLYDTRHVMRDHSFTKQEALFQRIAYDRMFPENAPHYITEVWETRI